MSMARKLTSNTQPKCFFTCPNNNTISKAEYKNEVDTVWVLQNWDMEFEALKSMADCFINLGNGIKLRLFLKDQVVLDKDQVKTEYLSLTVTASHIKNLDLGIKVSLHVGYLNPTPTHSVSQSTQSTSLKELNYPLEFNLRNEASIIEIGNVNDHREQIVIDKFLPLSKTSNYNTNSALKIHFKKPETLKFSITAKLLNFDVSERVFEGNAHNNNPSICRDFMLMLKEEDNYSDIKLQTKENLIVDAHKFVLAARSPILRAQIEKKMKMNDFNGVIMVDMVAKTLEHVLKWMYSDEFEENFIADLENILHAAVAYELKELLVILDKKMIQICTVENMFQLMPTAKKLNLSAASRDIAEFIKINIEKMVV